MSFLTIGNMAIPVVPGAARLEDIVVGATNRSFAGNVRNTIRATYRQWQFTTLPLSDTTFNNLMLLIANRATVLVYGDFNPAGSQCAVTVKNDAYEYDYGNGAALLHTLSLHVEEVGVVPQYPRT